jgi:hypothetical protein
MGMVCHCSGGRFKCGVHEVDAVSVILTHYVHYIALFKCDEVEEVGFSGKVYAIKTKKEVGEDGREREYRILEIYA